MKVGPALILLTTPVSKTLLWNYFQQPSCQLIYRGEHAAVRAATPSLGTDGGA